MVFVWTISFVGLPSMVLVQKRNIWVYVFNDIAPSHLKSLLKNRYNSVSLLMLSHAFQLLLLMKKWDFLWSHNLALVSSSTILSEIAHEAVIATLNNICDYNLQC